MKQAGQRPTSYGSPQPMATPRPPVATKYASPQPGTAPLATSTVKKPVIKFTYGQPSKSDPYRSTVSKQSEVKSPGKNGYAQSYAGDTGKRITSPPESQYGQSVATQNPKKDVPKP